MTSQQEKANFMNALLMPEDIVYQQPFTSNNKRAFEDVEAIPQEPSLKREPVDHIKHLVGVKDDLKSQIKSLQSILGESNFDDEYSEDDFTFPSF
ncbi:hypothetical protein RO3G_16842 [Rhizopus delemar RA 99-880]|uniref:Uncharacterized protein n=1 Tax=Rhizopus delemar (strain RA 99-880 / ATCC MYA-4621 / FGSC 9543 / NRRL 43880) TaxID=246409 RepID=I1CUK1_RHIO9|nr:hypothetical protein RO3G_16842 [Rhizopus delemar RA 99-880]|eukprot:EIE92131.1 hypothetical protein RO3G_16842 [Rhizopus delemar RA 99-880]